MTETVDIPYGDFYNIPYWDAAKRHQLVMQHCRDCNVYQYYGRPFCLNCDGTQLNWKPVSGKGRVYSLTRVHMSFSDKKTPFTVALVDLVEGPRLLTNIIDDQVAIGDYVTVDWQERADAPPLAVFKYDEDMTQ